MPPWLRLLSVCCVLSYAIENPADEERADFERQQKSRERASFHRRHYAGIVDNLARSSGFHKDSWSKDLQHEFDHFKKAKRHDYEKKHGYVDTKNWGTAPPQGGAKLDPSQFDWETPLGQKAKPEPKIQAPVEEPEPARVEEVEPEQPAKIATETDEVDDAREKKTPSLSQLNDNEGSDLEMLESEEEDKPKKAKKPLLGLGKLSDLNLNLNQVITNDDMKALTPIAMEFAKGLARDGKAMLQEHTQAANFVTKGLEKVSNLAERAVAAGELAENVTGIKGLSDFGHALNDTVNGAVETPEDDPLAQVGQAVKTVQNVGDLTKQFLDVQSSTLDLQEVAAHLARSEVKKAIAGDDPVAQEQFDDVLNFGEMLHKNATHMLGKIAAAIQDAQNEKEALRKERAKVSTTPPAPPSFYYGYPYAWPGYYNPWNAYGYGVPQAGYPALPPASHEKKEEFLAPTVTTPRPYWKPTRAQTQSNFLEKGGARWPVKE